jgi:hypothetical protein
MQQPERGGLFRRGTRSGSSAGITNGRRQRSLHLCCVLVGQVPSCLRRTSFDQLIHRCICIQEAVALGVANHG